MADENQTAAQPEKPPLVVPVPETPELVEAMKNPAFARYFGQFHKLAPKAVDKV
jgi:hypothetical protein